MRARNPLNARAQLLNGDQRYGSLSEALLCERTAMALARLLGCAGSPEPYLFALIVWYPFVMSCKL